MSVCLSYNNNVFLIWHIYVKHDMNILPQQAIPPTNFVSDIFCVKNLQWRYNILR
jgi:hypothetical protein